MEFAKRLAKPDLSFEPLPLKFAGGQIQA